MYHTEMEVALSRMVMALLLAEMLPQHLEAVCRDCFNTSFVVLR
jgi:hypothetical protein